MSSTSLLEWRGKWAGVTARPRDWKVAADATLLPAPATITRRARPARRDLRPPAALNPCRYDPFIECDCSIMNSDYQITALSRRCRIPPRRRMPATTCHDPILSPYQP